MRKLFLVLLTAPLAFSQVQSQPTVFAQVLNSSTTLGPTFIVRSIGQQFHHLDVFGTGTGCANTNLTPTGSLIIEGSNDGANFNQVGVPVTFLFASGSAAAGGIGYAPGDTGTISGGDGTATYMVLDIGAGGTVLTVSASGGTGYSTSKFNATMATSGAGTGLRLNIIAVTIPGMPPTVGVVTSGTVTPIAGQAHTDANATYPYIRVNYKALLGTTCPITVYYTGTLNGSSTTSAPFSAQNDSFSYYIKNVPGVVGTCFASGSPLQVYGMAINAPGGANIVTLTLTYGTAVIWTYNIGFSADNIPFILPQGSRPYFFAPVQSVGGSSYKLTATQSGGEVDYAISFRCE